MRKIMVPYFCHLGFLNFPPSRERLGEICERWLKIVGRTKSTLQFKMFRIEKPHAEGRTDPPHVMIAVRVP
jgi:hypothetical protein